MNQIASVTHGRAKNFKNQIFKNCYPSYTTLVFCFVQRYSLDLTLNQEGMPNKNNNNKEGRKATLECIQK